MKKKLGFLMLTFMLIALAACGNDNAKGDPDTDLDELQSLDVELHVTEEADVDETVDMEADVTYGDENVDDADEVIFEVWEEGDQDNSEMIDSTNNEDGSYSAETAFDHDGLFHVQVHVTARDLHTMPKKEITVGEGGEYDEAVNAEDEFDTDGFSMHFMEPEDVKAGDETELMTHIEIDKEALKDADVRYEIWNYDEDNKHDWVDADETESGEYTGTHTFEEAGTYSIEIHVEDDDDLHEHTEVKIEVGE